MKLTEYAKHKLLEGYGLDSAKTTVQCDLQIKLRREGKKGREIWANVYLVERGGSDPIYVVMENILLNVAGDITIQSPDGLMSVPVEIKDGCG